MAAVTSSRANSNLLGYGGLGLVTLPMLTSFSSSLPLPLGIPSSDPTTPNLGLRFNSNSGSVPFCSTKPLLPSSSVPPIPLQLPPQLPNLLLFQNLILLLHGDDVYFTLENSLQDGVQHREGGASSKNQSKSGSATVSGYVDSELDRMSQRYRNEELPETWYSQFTEKYKANKLYGLVSGDRESQKRSAEEMASYLLCANNHKKMRAAFKEGQHMGFVNSSMEHVSNMQLNGGNYVVDDSPFLPEITFELNCVPNSALPSVIRVENNQKVKLISVLDTLPPITSIITHHLPFMYRCQDRCIPRCSRLFIQIIWPSNNNSSSSSNRKTSSS